MSSSIADRRQAESMTGRAAHHPPRAPEDLSFLSRTATEFVEMPPDEDIYDYISARLRDLVGGIPVIVTSYEKETGKFTLRSFKGAPQVIAMFQEYIGGELLGKEFRLSEKAAHMLFERHIHREVTADLYELTAHSFPEPICRRAEGLMNLGAVYAMGFARGNELLGSASLYFPRGRELERREIVETFINQASVALQRRRADEALRRSVSLMNAALESTADGLLVVDGGGHIVQYNHQFAAMWDIPEDLLDAGDDAGAIAHILGRLKFPERFVARVQELYDHPEQTSFDVVEFADGRIYERYSQPQRIDGTPVGRVWSFRDVTERKKAESELRRSERRYRQVVEGVREVIFETDAAGLWTLLNPAWTEITGFPVEESLGVSFLEFVLPEDREGNLAVFRPLIEREKEFCRHEVRYRTRDGGFRWIEVHARLILDDAGKPAGTTGTLRDITEHKRAAEELRALVLQTERDARTKAELLREVNHRVKNNLLAVQGLLLAGRRRAEAEGRPEAGTAIDAIASRIDGLLSVHRLLSSSQWGPIPVSRLAETIIARVASAVAGDARIRLDVAPSPVEVSPRQASSLALVFNELATNTMKHAIDGRKTALVRLSARLEGDTILIEYADDGPGYPDDVLSGRRTSTGMHLVGQLVTGTLRGRLELRKGEGACAVMHIKVEESGRT
ncbi:MAG TPA: PAS domain S-box protein [Bacteroidota bacterium]|nr:PAS domain S-box protein [Bacteroidota bacterium]